MAFEAFVSPLSWQQVSLLLDTVQYFEDAPKLLSLPQEQGASVPVPITSDTLKSMLDCLDQEEAFSRKAFSLRWETTEDKESGFLVVELPNGDIVRQPAVLSAFSPV
ncbi:hypothetical protein E8L90_06970 [Brevibacillus antibioticus]|uniref:Uncharacterized protein n=1 Tax=Brevibacillus antibioticus TaxID=2570228 RepID=A0A4U2Y450_9BACL|nr:hypothetical protein [Brevibacillus antibioticus]TKI55207.1 hypothetical protein E8L90_06970 [Brevibacillus antibioticus]